MNTDDKIQLLREALVGKHSIRLIAERTSNPFNKGRGANSFVNKFGFDSANCIKRSTWKAFGGTEYNYAELVTEHNETSLQREDKRVVNRDETTIIPNVLKRNNVTGNHLFIVFNLDGFEHTTEWFLDGKPFDVKDERYAEFFKKPSTKPVNDKLNTFTVNLDNITSLEVDGQKLW